MMNKRPFNHKMLTQTQARSRANRRERASAGRDKGSSSVDMGIVQFSFIICLVALVAALSIALGVVVLYYTVILKGDGDGVDHLNIIPSHDFTTDFTVDGVCPVGYSAYNPDSHFVQTDKCVVTRPSPSAVDDTIKDLNTSPCVAFHEYSCGKWLHEAPKTYRNRSFDVIRTYTQQYMEEMQKNIYENTWSQDVVGELHASCVHSQEETSTLDTNWVNQRVAAIELAASRADLAFIMGDMESLGFVTVASIDWTVNMENTAEDLLYVNQDGVIGDYGGDDYIEMLRGLLTKYGRESYVNKVFDIQTSMANAWQGAVNEDPDVYIQSGEFAADLFSFATLKSTTTFPWEEFIQGMSQNVPMLYTSISSRRLWVFKNAFFVQMGQLWNNVYTIEDWKSYLITSLLFGSFWAVPKFFPDVHIQAVHKKNLDFTKVGGDDLSDGNVHHTYQILPWLKPSVKQLSWMRNTEVFRADKDIHVEFHWNPYPMPSDTASSIYKSICNDITWVQMIEKFEEYFVRTRKINLPLMRHYEGRSRHFAHQLIDADVTITTTQAERNSLKSKIDNIIFRYGIPNRGVPAFYNTLDLHEFSLLSNINLVSFGRFKSNAERWIASQSNIDKDGVMPTTNPNAYYDPLANEVMILGGILEDPFEDNNYSNTSRITNIVHIFTHEMFHSLDEHRIVFDETGSFRPSWIPNAVYSRLQSSLNCLESQFSRLTFNGATHNGLQTRAENYADFFGRKIAEMVLEEEIVALTPAEKTVARKEFYEAFAQSWCSSYTVSEEQNIIQGSVHAIPQMRVDRSLENSALWGETYSCGAPYVPTCTVW
jgi:predicted metalloendopeptidase